MPRPNRPKRPSLRVKTHRAALALALLACGSRSDLMQRLPSDSSSDEPAGITGSPPPSALTFENAPTALLNPGDSGCVDLVQFYDSVPARVLLLVDQSGSMNFPFGPRRRWSLLRDAIIAPDTGLLALLEPDTQVGVLFYSSLDGFAGGTCPLLATSGLTTLGDQGADAIRQLYTDTQPIPSGDTPTGEALEAAMRFFPGSDPRGPRYIVLLTDGEPDTCAQPDPQRGLGRALRAATSAFDAGVRVLTVGVSEQLAGQSLQLMANAGAGKPLDAVFGLDPAAERPLSASSDPAALASQIHGALGAERACVVDLNTGFSRVVAQQGEVILDGNPLPFNAVDGWTFAEGTSIEIVGSSCESILTDGQQLQVRFPCESERTPR